MPRILCATAFLALSSQLALAQFGDPNAPTLDEPAVSPSTPFVVDFESGTANFGLNEDRLVPDLGADIFTAAGGVGGSQQLQTVQSLSQTGNILFRSHAALGTAGLAFTGDWIAAGVDSLSYTIQHNAPIDLRFGLRVATRNLQFGSDNFPAIFGDETPLVSSGVPAELTFEISDEATFDEAPFAGGFNDVLQDVTNFQVQVFLPEGFASVSQSVLNAIEFGAAEVDGFTLPNGAEAGDVFDAFVLIEDVPVLDENGVQVLDPEDNPVFFDAQVPTGSLVGFSTLDAVTFGLDNVTITAVPEPGAIALSLIAGVAGLCRRRV